MACCGVAGKSTLLKLMVGDLMPSEGEVKRHSHLSIARYHQHSVDQLDNSAMVLEFFQVSDTPPPPPLPGALSPQRLLSRVSWSFSAPELLELSEHEGVAFVSSVNIAQVCDHGRCIAKSYAAADQLTEQHSCVAYLWE